LNCSAASPFCAALAYISRAGRTIITSTMVMMAMSTSPIERGSFMRLRH